MIKSINLETIANRAAELVDANYTKHQELLTDPSITLANSSSTLRNFTLLTNKKVDTAIRTIQQMLALFKPKTFGKPCFSSIDTGIARDYGHNSEMCRVGVSSVKGLLAITPSHCYTAEFRQRERRAKAKSAPLYSLNNYNYMSVLEKIFFTEQHRFLADIERGLPNSYARKWQIVGILEKLVEALEPLCSAFHHLRQIGPLLHHPYWLEVTPDSLQLWSNIQSRGNHYLPYGAPMYETVLCNALTDNAKPLLPPILKDIRSPNKSFTLLFLPIATSVVLAASTPYLGALLEDSALKELSNSIPSCQLLGSSSHWYYKEKEHRTIFIDKTTCEPYHLPRGQHRSLSQVLSDTKFTAGGNCGKNESSYYRDLEYSCARTALLGRLLGEDPFLEHLPRIQKLVEKFATEVDILPDRFESIRVLMEL